VLALLTIVLANVGSYALAHKPPVHVSGYETFLGIECTLRGQPSACGVTFSGWIGGDGQVPDGWEHSLAISKGCGKLESTTPAKRALGT
jgi:hypothetical protein